MGLRPSVGGDGSSSSNNNIGRTRVDENANDNDCNADQNNQKPSENISNTASTPLPPVQRKAWTERGQLLLNFHDVISRAINSPEMIKKCSQIAEDMSEHEDATSTEYKSDSLASDYSAEANLIIENKSKRDAVVRNKTIAVGLCVFGMLRGGRGVSQWMRNAAAHRAALASRYKFDSLPSSFSGAARLEVTLPKPTAIEKPTKLRRMLRLAVDLTISTTIALLSGEYLFIPRPSSYIEDMAKLPMVEGKSLYAEMVCPPLLKEYKHVLEKYGRWPVMSANPIDGNSPDGKSPLTQEDVSLNIIRKFAENCSKRSKYEQAILQERNVLAKHRDAHRGLELFHRITKGKYSGKRDEWVKLGDVKVPSGGVPDDVDVDLEKDVMSLDESDVGK
jgi:hypothetical protein